MTPATHARPHRWAAATTSLVVTISMAIGLSFLAGSSASAGAAASGTSATQGLVSRSTAGEITSHIRGGSTAAGNKVTGGFTPMRFIKKDGKLKVRGLLTAVVHHADGSTERTSVVRTMRVQSVAGVDTAGKTAGAAAAACDILHLVLGPLDLDLLGLQVHLDRVVLDIAAVPGAGNLLGNLLCAVAGLLDGGLQGVLGRLTDLLNQILAVLQLRF